MQEEIKNEITKEKAFDYLLQIINFQMIRDGSGRGTIQGHVNITTNPIAKFIYETKMNKMRNVEKENELKELARLKSKYETQIPSPPEFPKPILMSEGSDK